jgi:hypothetical protein
VLSTSAPTILTPDQTAQLRPPAGADSSDAGLWLYRYEDSATGWRLSIATFAEPGSNRLSLGGFRIATEERTASPGFDSDREAIGLAIGMERKVSWSRRLGIGGPLGRRETARVVGGKCVLHPTPDARVGQPHDFALLTFALDCFHDVEERAGFRLTTGQDLGHGLMSDGQSTSLQYLNARFAGCVVADTSQPTGEGNFHVLHAMLRGADLSLAHATVALIGCGNVGTRVLSRLREHGTTIRVLDASPRRRDELAAMGLDTYEPSQKLALLASPIDAVVVNAAGGTLDDAAITTIVANPRVRVICGCENLALPDGAAGSERLRAAAKAFAPTELGGMMGYLTAVEEYLARAEGQPFDVATMVDAAALLDPPVFAAMEQLRAEQFARSFEDVLIEQCGAQ